MKVISTTSIDTLDNGVTHLAELSGTMSFRAGGGPSTTGVFIEAGDRTYEVLAVTHRARQALGRLASGKPVEARVHGTFAGSRGQLFRAVDMEIRDLPAPAEVDAFERVKVGESRPARDADLLDNFGKGLVALFEAVSGEPEAAQAPRRLNNLYFHPSIEGRVLETVRLPSSGGRLVLALYDRESEQVWFKSVEQGRGTYRGPYTTEAGSQSSS